MALSADVANLEHQVLGKFSLNAEIVLGGVLRPHVRLKFTEKFDWAEPLPILRLTRSGIENSVVGIRINGSSLAHEGRIEKSAREERAAAERWLRAELLHHQLLHWIVKQAPSRTNAGLSTASKQFAEETAGGVWAVG